MKYLLMLILALLLNMAWADETSVTRGTTAEGYVRLKNTTNSDGVTTTKGTIGGKYVSTKTKDGVTKGTVDGKYVRVKTKTSSW